MSNLVGSIKIKEIKFTGPEVTPRLVKFDNKVKVINGASNTGKSFLVESIDYILGKTSIDKISESSDYDELSVKISINSKKFTIYRGFPSGKFEVYESYLDNKDSNLLLSNYKTGNDTKLVKNIGTFFWKELCLDDHEIVKNLWGEKNKLTLRLLSKAIISTEENIISLDSPIVTGDSSQNTLNRHVFRFLLTGKSDSEVKTIVRENVFNSENKGRVSALSEVVNELSSDLSFPEESLNSLEERKEKLTKAIDDIEGDLFNSQKGVSEILKSKKSSSKELLHANDRLNILVMNKKNFERLSTIYDADIERLQSQEEAAFLLTAGHDGKCTVCGNGSESVSEELASINLLSKASIAEVEKIKRKKIELTKAIESLDHQRFKLLDRVEQLRKLLRRLDEEYREQYPAIKEKSKQISELVKSKNLIEKDLLLRKRVTEFQRKLLESEASKSPKKYESKDFFPPDVVINEFCSIYAKILKEIEYPSDYKVSFDFKRYDVIIDGNPRHLNGKGVRAILNSVFKIALLLHCREKKNFHPGLVILDSPLVTYRDPLKSKHGELDQDEEELAKLKISYRFFRYLHSIGNLAQFIIVENIDVPSELEEFVDVESFYGKDGVEGEREGLF